MMRPATARLAVALAVIGCCVAAQSAMVSNALGAQILSVPQPDARDSGGRNPDVGTLPDGGRQDSRSGSGNSPEDLAPGSVAPEARPAGNSHGRYTFDRMDDGYLRLDSETGQVSFCSKRAVGWICEIAPEDPGAMENEIARLQGENAALKKELLTRAPPPLPDAVKEEPPAPKEPTLSLPGDPGIERVKAMVGRAWRQLVDMVASLQRDVLKKS